MNKNDIIINKTAMLEDAEIAIFAYGSVARSARSALRICREEGIKVGLFQPTVLWPFPEDDLREVAGKVKGFVVPEMNMGQMAREVERASRCDTPVYRLNRVDGQPITPGEIVELIKGVV